MHYQNLSQHELHTTLRAAKAVALADGEFSQRERALMSAATEALALTMDIDALSPITPAEAASALGDPNARLRLVQAQLIMAMMDGDIKESELAVIRDFCKALDVNEPRLNNLRQYMAGHFLMIKLDLNRRSRMVNDVAIDAYRKRGLRGVWKTLGPFLGFAPDAEKAWRYKQLGLLPEGTLGRAYWAHMTERRFALPGEPGGFPEEFAKHDLCHVLGDYNTESSGECEVVGFVAGFMRADPFWYLFMIAMHMHLGVQTFENTPTAKLSFDPQRVAAALKRGSQVNADLYDIGFDWQSLFPRPIEEVRARYNILPK